MLGVKEIATDLVRSCLFKLAALSQGVETLIAVACSGTTSANVPFESLDSALDAIVVVAGVHNGLFDTLSFSAELIASELQELLSLGTLEILNEDVVLINGEFLGLPLLAEDARDLPIGEGDVIAGARLRTEAATGTDRASALVAAARRFGMLSSCDRRVGDGLHPRHTVATQSLELVMKLLDGDVGANGKRHDRLRRGERVRCHMLGDRGELALTGNRLAPRNGLSFGFHVIVSLLRPSRQARAEK
jgi:hypothetical protein